MCAHYGRFCGSLQEKNLVIRFGNGDRHDYIVYLWYGLVYACDRQFARRLACGLRNAIFDRGHNENHNSMYSCAAAAKRPVARIANLEQTFDAGLSLNPMCDARIQNGDGGYEDLCLCKGYSECV